MRTSLKAGPDLPKRGRSQNMLPPGRTVCQEQHGLHIVKGYDLQISDINELDFTRSGQ